MEIPGRNTSADATGVSRSGRVRKKSSKLADFESPDEIDTRFKRKTDRPQKSQKMMKVGPSMGADVYDDSDSYIDDDLIEVKDEPLEVDDWVDNDDGDDDMCDDGENMDDTNDALHVDDDSTDMPRETSNYSLAQSLYFSEKQGKKNIMLKDGQVVRRKKAQRKDKGKSRFTAYMLWAREIRPGIIQANPNMDFSAVNKRLGELWALVPTTQKYNWKRRAKRLAAKGNQKGSMISTGKAAKQSQNAARSNLINKGGVKPQQVIRTPSKQSEGQSAPATTHKAHTTPKDVTIMDRQDGEELAGESAVSETNTERLRPQATALTVGRTGETDLKWKEERKSICSMLKCIKLGYLETIEEIFKLIKSRSCESHLMILEDAVRMLFFKKMTWREAAVFFCISHQRLKRIMTVLVRLKKNPTVGAFYKTLEDIMQITDNDKFVEWMLRMRKMGRLPILNDTRYIKQYIGLSYHPRDVYSFLDEFGEKRVQYEDWCTMTESSITKWKEMLKKFLFDGYDIIAEMFLVKENSARIFNCVEMFLSHTHVANQVVIFRGHRNLYNFVCPSRRGIRVMVTFSAAGFYLKPLFLQKGYHIPIWNDPKVIDQSKFHTGASGDGEVDPLLFVTWLRLFNTELVEHRIEKPVLLLLHGHPCHASLAASTFCQEEGIILYSHNHTPLNVLDPFSRMLSKFYFHYERSLNVFQNYLGKANLSLKYFPIIFLDAWNQMNDKDVALDAFEKSGLVPFDLSVVHQNLDINLVQSPKSALIPDPLKMFTQNVLPDAGLLHTIETFKLSSVYELLLHHNYARSPKDPLRVVFEPLLDNMQSSINVVHVCEKYAQDKQDNLDNERDLPSTRLVDDCDVDSKDCINVTSQNITSGGIKTTGETPGIKLEQTICEDILPSQSYEPKDVCYVKLETSTVEDLKNDTAEFPSVYTACENSTEEHVLPSLSWELEKTRDEHCVVMDAFDCPNTCNCEKIVCDVVVPSPCDSHELDTDDDDRRSVGGCSSPET